MNKKSGFPIIIIDLVVIKHLFPVSKDGAMSVFFQDPYLLELPFTIFSATKESQKLCVEKPIYEMTSDFPNLEEIPNGNGFYLSNAFKRYSQEIYLSALQNGVQRRDIIYVISASENQDSNFEEVLNNFNDIVRRRLGIVVADLGGYLQSKFPDLLTDFADVLISYNSYSIKRNDLEKLLWWIPEMIRGFVMTDFEDHPYEPSWFNAPPEPFKFRDIAFERKEAFWKSTD